MDKSNLPYYPHPGKPEPCECPESNDCSKVGYQYVDISVPVELKQDATIGEIETKCCGEPTVCCKEEKCGGTCEITITQKVCIKIPINYNVIACVGEGQIDCDCCDECCK